MITEKDLQEAIAECQGTRNPDARTCIKLAAYLTIKEHLYPQVVENDSSAIPVYSYAEPPSVEYTGDSVFSQSVSGKDMNEVWKIMDELMDTLQVIQPRLYDSVIRKIDSI